MSAAAGSILLTGANGGLGSAIVKQITADPRFASCRGLYAVRDTLSASVVKQALSTAPSDTYSLLSLDLDDLDSVRAVARTVNARVASGALPPIRALILNAGSQDFGNQTWTPSGLDRTFTSNYLGHWLLTLLLLQSMDKTCGRIIVIGSQSHK